MSLALAWPSKDNVKVKVRQNKALCGALVGEARITQYQRKTSLSDIREGRNISG